MNWGKGIILAFVLFVGVIFTMVYVSVNTDFHLVEEDYYEQELAYQDQIDRIKNFENLSEKPVFQLDRKTLEASLTFGELANRELSGVIKFYRANSSAQDKEMDLSLNAEGRYTMDVSRFATGAWKMKVLWSEGDKEYYKEYAFVI